MCCFLAAYYYLAEFVLKAPSEILTKLAPTNYTLAHGDPNKFSTAQGYPKMAHSYFEITQMHEPLSPQNSLFS